MLNLSQLQTYLEEQLNQAGISEYRQETRWIIEAVTGLDQLKVRTAGTQLIEADKFKAIQDVIQRRQQREPLQYILGQQAFLELDLNVSPGVLIPRPETEELVQAALNTIPQEANWRIAEMGCGSGAIGVALAYYRHHCQIFCSDTSSIALQVTEANAQKYRVKSQIQLLSGHGLEPFMALKHTFDLFISNPPYIAWEDWELLEPEVREHEPQQALTPGQDACFFYRHFAEYLPAMLEKGAPIWLELDAKHAEEIDAIFAASTSFKKPILHRDLQGQYRFLETYYDG